MEYHLKVKRRLRGIEGSLYLCIPKYWIDENGLQKNDAMEIEFVSPTELTLRVPDEASNE